jgi:DNA-binding transcriptional MerR regulator
VNGFRIGVLAERTSTNAPTIRYYEEIGLLRAADRREGGQRMYGEEDVKRLTFIRRSRELGFSIEQVRSLVSLIEDRERSCMHARDLASEHLEAVRDKLRELQALERSIQSFVRRCDTTCAGGPGPDCTILVDLAAPAAADRGTDRRVRGSASKIKSSRPAARSARAR